MKRTTICTAFALTVLGCVGVAQADTMYVDADDTVFVGPGDTVIYQDGSSPSYTVAADGTHVLLDGAPAAGQPAPESVEDTTAYPRNHGEGSCDAVCAENVRAGSMAGTAMIGMSVQPMW